MFHRQTICCFLDERHSRDFPESTRRHRNKITALVTRKKNYHLDCRSTNACKIKKNECCMNSFSKNRLYRYIPKQISNENRGRFLLLCFQDQLEIPITELLPARSGFYCFERKLYFTTMFYYILRGSECRSHFQTILISLRRRAL